VKIPQGVVDWLSEHSHSRIDGLKPLAGGCISQAQRLTTTSGKTYILKMNTSAPEDMFTREAEGLGALKQASGPRVPEPFLAGKTYLLLEDLAPEKPQSGYWESFGQQLANLHSVHSSEFGFPHQNYLGSTPQPNKTTRNGWTFFAEQRLNYQAKLAHKCGYLSEAEHLSISNLAAKLPELIPEQPASLLHGDLWSGNAMTGPEGEPAMIDPAAHYGWREAELGMTRLFGGFPERFYSSYDEAYPLESGWRARLPIYNLYHLLNHLNLFGSGYHGQVIAILDQFA
jgi:protein-ribulosamine 3-kinase